MTEDFTLYRTILLSTNISGFIPNVSTADTPQTMKNVPKILQNDMYHKS